MKDLAAFTLVSLVACQISSVVALAFLSFLGLVRGKKGLGLLAAWVEGREATWEKARELGGMG